MSKVVMGIFVWKIYVFGDTWKTALNVLPDMPNIFLDTEDEFESSLQKKKLAFNTKLFIGLL